MRAGCRKDQGTGPTDGPLTRRQVIQFLAAAGALVLSPFAITRGKARGILSRKEASFYRKLGVFLAAALLAAAHPGDARSVQKPVVAGSFYPADPARLHRMIEGFLDEAGGRVIRGDILGLIAPHAGYVYSGPVAGHAYRELQGKSYDLVVVIAPSHTVRLPGVAVLDVDAYSTPLGEIPIDREAAAGVMGRVDWINHVPALFVREHAVEVHLPFLQKTLAPGFRILPVVMGSPDPLLAEALADVLSRVLMDKNVLFIASSDMSHYHPYDRASAMDSRTLEYISRGELAGLVRSCSDRMAELCGLGPVQVLMHLAAKIGIEGGTVLNYANSGDTAGNKSRVVGYGSIAFVNPARDLALADKRTLLTLARSTLENYVRKGETPPARNLSASLKEPGAVFVSLKIGDQLRGCIGELQPTGPLHRSVVGMAVAACSRDRRFAPVSPGELERISVEISVLSPFVPVRNFEEIVIGRDGLYLVARGRSGVLLPQVPVEQGWTKERYLEEIAGKAGVPPEALDDENRELYRFSAQVFSE